jgi:Fibronectin type III domain/FG-GAP-like repeat/FG-GAP repeat
MASILATAGRLTILPRQPRPIRLDQRTVVLASVISLFGLLLQAQAATSVTLAWDSSGASGIAGYRLHYGTSSKSYSQTRDLGNTTTTTVSNLPSGQTYYFVVTDYDGAGTESASSNEVSFTATATVAVPIPNGSGVAKDFNNDGKADLIWENTSNGACVIWTLNNGVVVSNATIALPTLAPGWQIAAVGDFLANGQSDLVLENTINGSHCIWVMNNGIYVYTIALPTLAGGWHVVGAGDFNGDGYADLVWENTASGHRDIWMLRNGVYSSSLALPAVDPSWHIAGVGDFLGNGQSDLVWENTVSGGRAIWILNHGVLDHGISLGTVPTVYHIAGVADFNGDGKADLIWENTSTGTRAIWFLDNGVYSSSRTLPSVPTTWHIVNH